MLNQLKKKKTRSKIYNMDFKKRAEQYISDVLSGKIETAQITRKTFERHQNDLLVAPEKGWIFSPDVAVRKMKFKAMLKHTKGRKFAGQPFILEPWQCAVEYILFGWHNANGLRRFTESYTEIPKKNGKTAWAAAIAADLLILDNEPEAEVYCAATKKDQAKICFNQAKAFIEKNDDIRKWYNPKFVTNNISILSTGSKLEPLGRDSYGLDGINPSAAIIDEYHEWSKNDVRDSIQSATVSRLQSLEFIITTAGYNKTWPCFEYRKFIIDILEGIKIQDNVFGIIYTLDDGDDWRDEKNWAKANPNYGISVEVDKMKIACQKAINKGGTDEVTFKTKNLNIWVDAPTVWIQDEKVIACNHGTTDAMIIGKPSWDGIDLASHVDIAAYCKFFPSINGRPVFKLWFWIPESKVEEKQDRVDYRRWIADGYINVTEGNVIDIDKQVDEMYQIAISSDCQNIAFDPAKAYHGTVQGLQKKGLSNLLDEFQQSIRNMSEPTKELQRMVESAECDLLQNPVIRWMFRNAVVIIDSNDNIKLDKKKSIEKIDGLIAMVNAIGGYMSGDKIQPYKEHSLRTVKF